MRVLLLDFESRSRADLKTVGGRRYWDHPSTETLVVVLRYAGEDAPADVWFPGEGAPAGVCDPTVMLAAHNAMGFDRFGAIREWGEVAAPLSRWIDTSELARRAGLPGSLDALGELWSGVPKDSAGSKLTKGLSKVSRPTKKSGVEITPAEWRALSATEKRERGVLPPLTPEILERVLRYCESDVDILWRGWPLLEPWLDYEPAVSEVERIVNERGVQFDSNLARRLLEEDARNAAEVVETLAREIGWTPDALRAAANSPAQFVAHTGLPDAQALTVETALAGSPDDLTRALCLARQASASIVAGKLEAGLARVSDDGRLRDNHRYIGAHTWRWSGRGMQLQNMTRPAKRFEGITAAELDALVERVLAGGRADADEVALLMRATICAAPGYTLVDADFSGVEARVLAHLAGDELTLRTIREGLDPYKVNASMLFGVPYEAVVKPQRQAGKVATLACGYGGGANAIIRTAAKEGVDLHAAGVTPEEVVRGWREAHPAVVAYWRRIEDAMRAAIEFDEHSTVGPFSFCPAADGTGDVAVFMPSGRPIVYNGTRAAPGKWRSDLSYRAGRSGERSRLYGGLLVENLVQGLCREFLAEALVRAERAGLRPVLHVHDQAICEVPEERGDEALAELLAIMRDPPTWAAGEGYPIDADGHVGRRHRK